MKTIVNTLAVLFASLTSAFASGPASHVDTTVTYNSGILVLAFAGFLALVVVMQVIPAAVSLYEMIKKTAAESKSKQAHSTATK